MITIICFNVTILKNKNMTTQIEKDLEAIIEGFKSPDWIDLAPDSETFDILREAVSLLPEFRLYYSDFGGEFDISDEPNGVFGILNENEQQLEILIRPHNCKSPDDIQKTEYPLGTGRELAQLLLQAVEKAKSINNNN